jgi:hypothetical protein
LGHEERFPPTRLSAGCGFRKETLAGTRRNGRDAPIPGIRRGEARGGAQLPKLGLLLLGDPQGFTIEYLGRLVGSGQGRTHRE